MDAIQDAPWVVSLQRSGKPFCEGFILNDNTIATAVECLVNVKLVRISEFSEKCPALIQPHISITVLMRI